MGVFPILVGMVVSIMFDDDMVVDASVEVVFAKANVVVVVNPSITGVQVDVGIGVLHSTDSGGSTCGGLKNTKI